MRWPRQGAVNESKGLWGLKKSIFLKTAKIFPQIARRCVTMQDVSRHQTLSCYHCGHVHSTNLGPGILRAKREIRIRLRIARRGFACA
jgi:hypothetical protein